MNKVRTIQPKKTAAAAENPAESETVRNARLEAAALDKLARMGDIGMRFIERLDRRASGQMDEAELKAFPRVGDDCNAFVKVSRSVRQIIVLEHEIAGLRQPSLPRAANGNSAPSDREGLRTGGERGTRNDARDRSDNEDYDDYDDYDEGPFFERVERVCAAVMEDLAGTDMEEEARRASPAEKVTRYSAITTHPALDACLAQMTAIERGQLYTAGLGQGPPPQPGWWKKPEG